MRMKKQELAQRLADQEQVTPAVAADRLDDIIFAVLKKLKQGKSAAFPGLGRNSLFAPRGNEPEPSQPKSTRQSGGEKGAK